MATLSWCFAQASYTERPTLTAALARHAASHVHQYGAKQLATSALALGELGLRDAALAEAAAREMEGRLRRVMETQHVVNCAWAVALLGGGEAGRGVVHVVLSEVGDKVRKWDGVSVWIKVGMAVRCGTAERA